MFRIGLIIFSLISILTIVLGGVFPNYNGIEIKLKYNDAKEANDWWKTGNFYQIYPRSFQDSDGDGIGDLNGITSRLPYLKELGVTATWLSPIFKSPMVDFGYDIADYYEIDPIFGTMEDFKNMVNEAKKLGIRIILDFVPNHTSDESDWFKKSVDREPKYENFYVWEDGIPDDTVPEGRRPPTNWISVFRGSAWEWNEKRKQYYLHQFAKGQPDLNYENEDVRNEMKKVLEFWLDKGVSGFRVDAVPFIYECRDENNKFRDEPKRDGATDPEDYGYLVHDCTVDQDRTLEMVYEWRQFLIHYQEINKTETKVFLTEAWSPFETVMKYYDDGNGRLGSHIPFNFMIIEKIHNNSNAHDYADTINHWLAQMKDERVPNWVLGNHDKNRVGSRLGTDRIDMFNMLAMTLPGVAVTYQGEEIGMTDVWISWKDTQDPQACNTNPEIYERFSRDPERTPFQWNDDVNAGFSKSKTTWLPVGPNYQRVNLKRERGIGRSKINIYKMLRELRNKPAFKNNFKAEVAALNDNVLGIKRTDGIDQYVVLMNIHDNVEVVNLQSAFKNIPETMEYAIVTDRSPHNIAETLSTNEVVLLPKEAVVLKTLKNKSVLSYYFYKILNM